MRPQGWEGQRAEDQQSPLCLGHAPDRKSYTQAGRCCHLVDRSGMLRPRIGSEDLAPSGGLVLSLPEKACALPRPLPRPLLELP